MLTDLVFICHTPPDQGFAQALALALETCRIEVWRDHHHQRGGERIASEVRWAIEQARQVIVVLSQHTGTASWMRREIELAQEVERRRGGERYRIIPLLLPDTHPLVLDQWFTPPPLMTPLTLTAAGLSEQLPTLLAALGETVPGLGAAERDPLRLADLELTFSRGDKTSTDPQWRLSACLHRSDAPDAPLTAACEFSLPPLPDSRWQQWSLDEALRWPNHTVQHISQRVADRFAAWGQQCYQATLGSTALTPLTEVWRSTAPPCEQRLTVRSVDSADSDPSDPSALPLLSLPWEGLHDATEYLIQARQPMQIQRRLTGGGSAFLPVTPPLRLLVLGAHPDTEPAHRSSNRHGARALLEGTTGLGALLETRLLMPPTQAALRTRLTTAKLAGRPFQGIYLHGGWRPDPTNPANPRFGLEANPATTTPKQAWRTADFIPLAEIATLLATYYIRFVVMTVNASTLKAQGAAMATTLLEAGIAGVVMVDAAAPVRTLSRFWAAFYEEVLRGARLSQAVAAGQRRLASDSYRGTSLGGGGVYLADWSVCTLYLGNQDPRLALRPPLALWRRLATVPPLTPPSVMPTPPTVGCRGRERELLTVERLLQTHPALFIKGAGGSGKTTLAAELAHWLLRIRRYRQVAYVHADEAIDPHTFLEILGQQLLPAGPHWTVGQYPTLWQALDALRQALAPQPILIVLDQAERWSAEHDEGFQRLWRALADQWPTLRLLGLGRLGPPPFAQPWTEIKLAALDEAEAIALVSQALLTANLAPPAADSGHGFRSLSALVRLAGAHPGALRAVAREIAQHGVNAALARLRPLQKGVLSRHEKDPQWPLYLALELNISRLTAEERDSLTPLAFFKDGVHRIALEHVLGSTALAIDALCERLIALDLAEDRGYGHLRFDPALSRYLLAHLSAEQRTVWQQRWQSGMEQFLAHLYQQHFKDGVRVKRLLRLELSNLLALLRGRQVGIPAERTARTSSQLEQLLASLGIATALNEAAAARERAGSTLAWSRERFETERLRIERLRDAAEWPEALQLARQLLEQCQAEGRTAYPGAAYDQARAHFQLGKLLKMQHESELAVQELHAAHRQFQALADAGNASAARMAAVASAEAGDCLQALQRLQDAAIAYEAALAQSPPNAANSAIAANQLQLGLVRQRQGQHTAAALHYEAARKTFAALGDTEGMARAWRQLGLVRKLDGRIEPAIDASRQALALYEQQRNRPETAEILGELGHLYQVAAQLEESVQTYRRMADLYRELGDGRNEQASRNKLANVLLQLRRHDEARQELYRASECNPPESPTARQWAIRRGLRDIGQSVENLALADQARRQAIQKYLAYRRAGGKNTNPGAQLCAQTREAIQTGEIATLSTRLSQINQSPNIPTTGKVLITKLKAILSGSRDPALAADPELHYQYAAEIQLLLDDLTQKP